ncbi:MAG TPA: hypothetical protein DFS52_01890 [Myxococcales bacterium]|nr:hypothetical protein [Myxococcales bacterium]
MRKAKAILTAFAAAALLLPAGAVAQQDGVIIEEDQGAVTIEEPVVREEVQDRGLELQALGGIRSFTGDAGDIIGTGPTYGVLAAIEPFSALSLELSYQGATFQTAEGLPGEQSRINQNGGEAVLKVSPVVGDLVELYALGGIGLTQFTNTGVNELFVVDDTVTSIPVGIGADFHLPIGIATDFLIGARGTYEFAFGEDAFPGITDSRTDWLQVTLNAGAQF